VFSGQRDDARSFPSRDAVRATPISLSSESATKQRQLDRSEQEIVELDGRQRFFSLRDTWSRWIIVWISTSILTNVALTFMVGFGILDFQKYGWFINAVTVESFIQVVGLGYVAVRFLFSRG
jgi:hypothetical protein